MVDSLAGQFNPMKIMYLPGLNQNSGAINPGFCMGNPYAGNIFNFKGTNTDPYSSNPQRVTSYEDFQVRRAQSLATRKSAEKLVESIQHNRSTKIPKMYERFVANIRQEEGYKCLETEEQRQAYILNRFENITGNSLEELIDDNAHGSFVSGLYNTLTLGIAQDKSAAKLKEELLGEEPKRGTGTASALGRLGGGAAVGAGIGCFGGPVGAAIGAGIGAAVGLISWIWS